MHQFEKFNAQTSQKSAEFAQMRLIWPLRPTHMCSLAVEQMQLREETMIYHAVITEPSWDLLISWAFLTELLMDLFKVYCFPLS